MVIVGGQKLISIASWDAMDQYVVCGLDIERFLDLGIGRNEEVDQNERWYEQQERPRGNSHDPWVLSELMKCTR